MSIVVVIPARKGSKGVPGKNLKVVGGISLLERAIKTAKSTQLVDQVIVSTDDDLIAKQAKELGAEVPFMRPIKLADDNAKMNDVIKHVINEYEKCTPTYISTIVLLEPTVPFRTAEHVQKSIERYLEGNCNSVVTVCPLERKPQNILRKTISNVVEKYIENPKEIFHRRQDMSHLCRVSGGAYVVNRDAFFENNAIIVPPVGYVEMKNHESINIDEELDLILAEIVAERFKI